MVPLCSNFSWGHVNGSQGDRFPDSFSAVFVEAPKRGLQRIRRVGSPRNLWPFPDSLADHQVLGSPDALGTARPFPWIKCRTAWEPPRAGCRGDSELVMIHGAGHKPLGRAGDDPQMILKTNMAGWRIQHRNSWFPPGFLIKVIFSIAMLVDGKPIIQGGGPCFCGIPGARLCHEPL